MDARTAAGYDVEVVVGTAGALDGLDARVDQALRESLAANTWRAYAADWRAWGPGRWQVSCR